MNTVKMIRDYDEYWNLKFFKLERSWKTNVHWSWAYQASKEIHDKKVNLISNFDGEKIDNNWRSTKSD